MQTKLVKIIVALQPLLVIPVYFSVLTGYPPLWLSVIIAIMPLVIRYWFTKHIFLRTCFDIPILIFVLGTLIGFIVSPDKTVATGALISTLASILVYYGITENRKASRIYWVWASGIICFITLSLSFWFFSQSLHRDLFFNQWAFNLFSRLPKTSGPVLQLNTIGALLAVVIPPLFVFFFFKGQVGLRIAASISWLFFTGILFLSDSGAGWVAVAISLTFILVCWRRWLIWVLVPYEGLLIGAALIFYDKTEWLRVTFSTSSLISRIDMWQNTFTLLKGKAALTGLGLGAWLSEYNRHFTSTYPIVHNSYLQLYCDTGILGFIALIIAAIIFIRLSIDILNSPRLNSGHWIAVGLIGSIIAGAIFAIFDTTISETYVTGNAYIYIVLPLLWIGGALIAVVYEKGIMSCKSRS